MINGKSFFDLPVKNKEAYKKIIGLSENNDCTTGNLLDFAYFKENNRPIAINLSKQTKLKDPQQINFIGKLETQEDGVTMFFIIEKSEKNYFWVFAKLCQYLIKMETQKIVNLLNSSENEFSWLATKKWYVIDSETKVSYSHHDPI